MVIAPWQIATVEIVSTRHFELKYAARWRWSPDDLREAVRVAYRIDRTGKDKFEIYTTKGGHRKLIVAYREGRLIIISGARGGRRT